MSVEDPNGRTELSKKFKNLIKKSYEIQKSRNQLEEYSDQIFKDFSLEKNHNFSNLYDNISLSISSEQKKLIEIFQFVDDLILERQNLVTNFQAPSTLVLKAAFLEFVQEPLPIKQSPYPPLCGAIPLPPERLIPPRSFACVPVEDMFILAYVVGFDPETLNYYVCDVDSDGDEGKLFTIPINKIVPMPTSSPFRRSKNTNFSMKSQVYALWPDESGTWTSVFYPAIVFSIPNSSPGWYKLKFDGEPNLFADVPEKFVISLPQI